jgi:hypothetical protein
MPTFLAMLVSAFVGWLVEGPVRAVLGLFGSFVVSFFVSGVAFVFAKRFLLELRGGD